LLKNLTIIVYSQGKNQGRRGVKRLYYNHSSGIHNIKGLCTLLACIYLCINNDLGSNHMSLSIQSNASALQAFSKKISVSANNIANSLTDEFKSSRAINTEGADKQVATTITKSKSSGPMVEDPLKNDGSLKELSNTDIAEELVQQISAQHGFNANAKTIQMYEETVGSLFDVIG
jgi:flagellar hook protein FlgE